MSDIYSRSPKNSTLRCAPGDDRESREVKLKTKQMSWNGRRTSTNRRSKTVNLANKSVEGKLGGGDEQEGKKLQRSILSGNSCIKKKKSSPKLILNSKENKGGCTAADRK